MDEERPLVTREALRSAALRGGAAVVVGLRVAAATTHPLVALILLVAVVGCGVVVGASALLRHPRLPRHVAVAAAALGVLAAVCLSQETPIALAGLAGAL